MKERLKKCERGERMGDSVSEREKERALECESESDRARKGEREIKERE